MIKQHYSGTARQAVNIIWNAAQDYSFDPPFLAFHPNGKPDFYFNLILGLTVKWLDGDRIADFFERLGEGNVRDEASSCLWLGIENCIYGKELPKRPLMKRLRAVRAKEFFEINSNLSEQQMSLMSIKVYDQEEIRWSKVLGRKVMDVGPGARRLAQELEFDPAWDTDQVLDHMTQILEKHFRITITDHTPARGEATSDFKKTFIRILRPGKRRQTDLLILRKGTGTGDHKKAVHLTHNQGELHTSKDPEKDRLYIEEAFGPCIYSDAEMKILEDALCRDDDAGCRLWFVRDGAKEETNASAGRGRGTESRVTESHRKKTESQSAVSREKKALTSDREAQEKRNEIYFNDNLFRIRESIKNLTSQTETVLMSYRRFLPSSAEHGRTDAPRVWRLPVLDDEKIFLKDTDPDDIEISVDLLLDASQSRMNSQEAISTQALVIARSFEECGIKVRVTAFRSLRGYTVLETMKDYGRKRYDGIFRYYAGGWNRDALCLKAMDYLFEEEKREAGSALIRILMVLTDANPNDSVPIPPKDGGFMSREYEGDAPVRDAEEAVRMLRNHGISCGAVYYGSTSHLDQVHQIYGQQYARIHTLSQLPDAVSQLLQQSLRAVK